MTVVAVELVHSRKSELFVELTRKNVFFEGYFAGSLKVVKRDDKDWVFLCVQSAMPAPFGIIGVMGFISIALLVGLSPWLLAPVLVALPELLRSKWFWYYMTRRSLKRMGYTDTVRLLSDDELFVLVVEQ